jgi:hypothetical protein
MYKDDGDKWQLKSYVFSTVPGSEFEVTENWIRGKKFDAKTLEYWDSKKGTKITLKDFYKGPIKPTIES